jgi:hypothetical protein
MDKYLYFIKGKELVPLNDRKMKYKYWGGRIICAFFPKMLPKMKGIKVKKADLLRVRIDKLLEIAEQVKTS